ncbi:hypothetical protein WS96_09745 [Burkholderia sp. MSMB1835]|nr:hypothetical protein WS96_09745 [Burkholderia sp. MSMB1835]
MVGWQRLRGAVVFLLSIHCFHAWSRLSAHRMISDLATESVERTGYRKMYTVTLGILSSSGLIFLQNEQFGSKNVAITRSPVPFLCLMAYWNGRSLMFMLLILLSCVSAMFSWLLVSNRLPIITCDADELL